MLLCMRLIPKGRRMTTKRSLPFLWRHGLITKYRIPNRENRVISVTDIQVYNRLTNQQQTLVWWKGRKHGVSRLLSSWRRKLNTARLTRVKHVLFRRFLIGGAGTKWLWPSHLIGRTWLSRGLLLAIWLDDETHPGTSLVDVQRWGSLVCAIASPRDKVITKNTVQ